MAGKALHLRTYGPEHGPPVLTLHSRWVRECRRELGDELIVAEIDAGHMVCLECTAEVADLVRPFLGR